MEVRTENYFTMNEDKLFLTVCIGGNVEWDEV